MGEFRKQGQKFGEAPTSADQERPSFTERQSALRQIGETIVRFAKEIWGPGSTLSPGEIEKRIQGVREVFAGLPARARGDFLDKVEGLADPGHLAKEVKDVLDDPTVPEATKEDLVRELERIIEEPEHEEEAVDDDLEGDLQELLTAPPSADRDAAIRKIEDILDPKYDEVFEREGRLLSEVSWLLGGKRLDDDSKQRLGEALQRALGELRKR